MKKRLLALLCSLIAAVCLLSPFVVSAEEPEEPEISCPTAAVYNLESKKLLFEKNYTGRLSPAAFTKLMTAMLALEYRETAGNVSVTVTEEMLSSFSGGTSMKLKVGETLPLDSLLEGLIVYGANDAALVLASVSGGNISSFVDAMNARAEELGMENTHYTNPTGVHSSAMYTTPEDTVLLCESIYRVNRFMLLSEKPNTVIPATNLTGERSYTNRNALVPFSYVTDYYMEGVRGMVSGYTQEAGWCVATVRQKKNATYLVIVSGGEDRSEKQNQTDISSYRDAKTLLEWAEESFAFQSVLTKGKIVCEKKVRLGAGVDHVILATGDEVNALLPVTFDPETDIRLETNVSKDTFTAPVIEGSSYGTMDVYYKDELLASVPLVAASGVGLSRWLVTWDAITGFFSHGPAHVALILVILAGVSYVGVLVGTVWVHHARETRAKRRAVKEMNQEENRRLRLVRQEEKKASRARLRRVTRALHEGFLVLSGETEDGSAGQSTPRRAVARVPEKYRKHPTPPRAPRAARPAAKRAPTPAKGQKRPVVRSTPQVLHRPAGIGQGGKKPPLKGEKVTLSVKRPAPNKDRKKAPTPPRPPQQRPPQRQKPQGNPRKPKG
ncbi:MAG: D-alanyl-D-alanine carboxypeptidase [Clostridia bacterium]|nr:D-alanyl-D-alanine carboxypeptidase [Clostridia bacterium]